MRIRLLATKVELLIMSPVIHLPFSSSGEITFLKTVDDGGDVTETDLCPRLAG